ncbi:MAG TPA: MarR family transcriptional regulator [Steroidobacteraceae bacterium]|nr:MarR family transcriptional regulator [Steroidobacteraceae bacterium]
MADVYSLETYEPKRGLGHIIGRVRALLLAAIDAELARDEFLAPLEVTSAQLIVIVNLAGRECATSASELCKGISYDAGAMTRMLDRLEAKGLVRRTRSPDDRRLVNLELTQAGKAAYPRLREISMRILNRSLRDFTRTEAKSLEDLLLRLANNLRD